MRSCAFSDLINWAGLFQGVISNDPTHKIKKTSGCDEVEQVACVLCSFLQASSLQMNAVYFYLSSACLCRPHQGGFDRPCRESRRKVLQSRGVCYYPPSRQVALQTTAV